MVKILQGSVVTQTMLGGLTIYPPAANFLWCISAKNYENWLLVDKVIAANYQAYFFWPTRYMTFEHNLFVLSFTANYETDYFCRQHRKATVFSLFRVFLKMC